MAGDMVKKTSTVKTVIVGTYRPGNEAWIDAQIDVICKENGLDRTAATADDDWHVEIDANSAYQFDIQEEYVH